MKVGWGTIELKKKLLLGIFLRKFLTVKMLEKFFELYC